MQQWIEGEMDESKEKLKEGGIQVRVEEWMRGVHYIADGLFSVNGRVEQDGARLCGLVSAGHQGH